MKTCLIAVLIFVTGGAALNAQTSAKERSVRDIVGSSHVAGKYAFTDQDYLNEGADRLLELGTRVIKLWFTSNPKKDYPFNSDWPEFKSMVELAKTPYYRKVFAKPFTTFILEAFPPGDVNYLDGMTPEETEWVRKQTCDLARYLLTEYKGTGKTFVLQNWEGDWMLTNPQFTKNPTKTAMVGMIDWLNARQDGVEQARKEVGTHGVMVAHAAEVNLVVRAMDGKLTATNNVIPHTRCDLYSYSAYDSSLMSAKKFLEALDYLAEKAPDSKLYGSRNVYVGEFGAPEKEFDQGAIVKRTVETALDWGARYVVYWQLYCNEPANRDWKDRSKNSDMRGFWLIRPDGTKSPAWEYFRELLQTKTGTGK